MHIQALSFSIVTFLASIGVRAQVHKDPYHISAFGRPNGIDAGNKVCGGACVTDPNALACKHIELGCFECCLSDDDLDHLDFHNKAVPDFDDDTDYDTDEDWD
ncbi:predicted protein [Aspergillus nidulans FGSC A4]|nr:predicted protein [Aspergillus nidulans FGSC A4]|eukprot:XP_680746.1 predicted protein [Aspergillus nidulans FGSC A4]